MNRLASSRAAPIAVGALAVLAAAALIANSSTGRCADVDRLSQEAETDFNAISGPVIESAEDERSTTYLLDGASFCSILTDPEQVLYLCSWEFELGSTQSRDKYESELVRVRSCLDEAQGREDTSVNHPDFWVSTHFEIPAGELTLSLKDKGALGKTFVTMGASGRR